ncbi:TonB-dependent receptor [Dyadobacter sandarakinus]|uniref:TonB-dependent receptor n=1 Tax=Dyadobacter sandarakinus TaxID=2747268 RepID=A0ABX7I3B8_9BACT|nr:TonB-dependent receptor [Dyadobacter sandarakinus]QRR00329.1 TonB-dependent receptor [Dyadobacter sandarakinus]
MRHPCYKIFFLLLYCTTTLAQQSITISGFVRERGSRELLPGVNVYIPNSAYGVATNHYGFYSLSIPAKDSVMVSYSFVGYETRHLRLKADVSRQVDVELAAANVLNEVIVSEKRQNEKASESARMSTIEIPVSQIKKLPAFFGEKDVIRVLQLMPGVQKGSEGQTGLYVRGGGPDQNLIILDDAVVYNASHLFGFFSVFNGDALKSVELVKGGFPARYGGRLSSVVEMNMKEGSKEKLHGEGGIGLISSRLTLEGPLMNKKASFLVSARRTYIDFLAKPVIAQQQTGNDSKTKPGYYFYDLNAKLNYDLDARNKLYISGYFGRDRFHVSEKTLGSESSSGLNWGNATATLRWNHLINPKLFVNTSLIYSRFVFNIYASDKDKRSDGTTEEYNLSYNSLIRDYSLKTDFDYYPHAQHAVKFGLVATAHRFVPSALTLAGAFPGDVALQAKPIHTVETGIYAEDTWQPFPRMKINAGMRLSTFQTKSRTYFRPEPRISASWKAGEDLAVKASYAQMNQYVHLLSNTGLGLPTDLWVPTTDSIPPQQSQQLALGLARDLEKPGLTFTLEGYYKRMNNIISYKEGSSFIRLNGQNANELNWESNVTSGKGWSYGLEMMVQKKTGKLSGWVGYTLSRTQWKFDELNFGRTFHPRYDRRHDVSVVGIYELSKRITLSATWVYGTGNALTIPAGTFTSIKDARFENIENGSYSKNIYDYSEKNSFRAEAYHRLDLAVQFHKKKKRHERTWEFGLYNAYNRRNPFFYRLNTRYKKDGGMPYNTLVRYSLFPVLPSFSYNFKF